MRLLCVFSAGGLTSDNFGLLPGCPVHLILRIAFDEMKRLVTIDLAATASHTAIIKLLGEAQLRRWLVVGRRRPWSFPQHATGKSYWQLSGRICNMQLRTDGSHRVSAWSTRSS